MPVAAGTPVVNVATPRFKANPWSVCAELRAEQCVFDKRQRTIRDIFPNRHPTAERIAAQDARAEHAVIEVVSDE